MFQRFNDNVDKQELQTFILLQADKDTRKVYYYNDAKNIESKSFTDFMYKGSSSMCQDSDQIKMKTLSNTKASSTVDINGDCMPDLILETIDESNSKAILEFYYATKDGLCLVAVQALNDDYLMASFADFSNPISTR